jgi:dTDP-4-amino-4,6-dideoxy-D-galactose acyltransferase
MKGDCPRGLLTLDRRDDKNVIGLVAVDEDCQHQGIGTALIKHAVTYVHEHQGNRLSVATQLDNEPACRLYSRCGFSLESVTKIWHWWL